MEVVLTANSDQASRLAAKVIADVVRAKPAAVIGTATGSSPLGIYDELTRLHTGEGLSFAQCQSFNLDEYVGIAPDHPQRYLNFIRDNFTSRVDFRPQAVHGPDGNADDIPGACAAYEQAIHDAGGIDVQILGIGADGHIAFNEPGSSLTSRTRIKTLTPKTIADNARFFDDDESLVPHHCLTQGLGTIMEARQLVLIASGENKSAAIAACVEGPVSASCPASIIQFHPHVTLVIDEAAAERLTRVEYYRYVFAHKPSWQGI